MADATLCQKSKMAVTSQLTGSSNIPETMKHRNSNSEPPAFDHGKLAGSVPARRFQYDRQSKMAVKTGNACISETMKGTVKIPTTNLGYKTMYM